MNKLFVTLTEAIDLLSLNKYIHTFRNGGNTLIGAGWEREDLIECMRLNENTLQIGGKLCKDMKHGLVCEDAYGFIFIEANPDKIEELEKRNS